MPETVKEVVGCLQKHLNILRIKTYRHVRALEEAGKVTTNDFKVIICNPQRRWMGDDYARVCLANSTTEIFTVISVKRHLNWQNYSLLEEIIEQYGDADLQGELAAYCHEVKLFEGDTPLDDVKNIIFTPLGPDQGLMRVPIPNSVQNPTMGTVRVIQENLKKNGFCTVVHHVGHNSPLAVFFIVPRPLLTPTSMAKLKATNSEKIEDRVVYTLSEDEVLELLDVS